MELIETNITKDLAEFNQIELTLGNLEQQANALKLENPSDKTNYQLIKSFRYQNLVKLRTAVEARRKEMKLPYAEAAKQIDLAANQIKTRIEQVETICEEQEQIYDNEQKRLAEIALAEHNAKVQARVDKLKAAQIENINTAFVQSCNDKQFEDYFLIESNKAKAIIEEKKKQEAELEKLRLENEARAKELQQLKADAAKREQEAKAEIEKQTQARIAAEKEAEEKLETQKHLTKLAEAVVEKLNKELEQAKQPEEVKTVEAFGQTWPEGTLPEKQVETIGEVKPELVVIEKSANKNLKSYKITTKAIYEEIHSFSCASDSEKEGLIKEFLDASSEEAMYLQYTELLERKMTLVKELE